MEIWDRYYELQISSLLITIDDLDIEFKVENSNKENASKAEIVIYNLSDATKSKIKKDDTIQLKAGYRNDFGIIFYGMVDKVTEEWEGGDVKTIVRGVDSTKILFEQTKIIKTYPKGTAVKTIVEEMFSLGSVPVGRVDDPGVKLPKDMTFIDTPYGIIQQMVRLTNGELLKGITGDAALVREAMNTSCFTAYIENNLGYFVRRDFKGNEVIVLSSETGLMEVTEQEDENAEIDYRVRCLLNWKCCTDALVQLNSYKVSGVFKVVEYSHVCKGEEYYSELGVKAI